MEYKHFILTRWNLGVYSESNPYADKVGNPKEWMENRIYLFEKYCLPTLIDQTCNDFTWVMAFDESTPRKILMRYDYIENVRIIYEQPHLWLRRQKPDAEWLITTRLDNDDYYDKHFVQAVQGAFMERTEIIDVNYEVVEMRTGKRFASGRRRNNTPFLSLVEPWINNPMTAMGKPHTYMPDIYNSRRLDGVLAYQLIHGMNVCNKIPR